MRAQDWSRRGHYETVFGHRVFAVHLPYSGPRVDDVAALPTFLVVHGTASIATRHMSTNMHLFFHHFSVECFLSCLCCQWPGYPTSSFDYARVVDRLAAHGRVYAHDHLGFGLSGTFGVQRCEWAIMPTQCTINYCHERSKAVNIPAAYLQNNCHGDSASSALPIF